MLGRYFVKRQECVDDPGGPLEDRVFELGDAGEAELFLALVTKLGVQYIPCGQRMHDLHQYGTPAGW